MMSLWDLSDSYSIMWACWENNPEDRPSFTALMEILGDLLQTCVQQVGHNYCVFIKTFPCGDMWLSEIKLFFLHNRMERIIFRLFLEKEIRHTSTRKT